MRKTTIGAPCMCLESKCYGEHCSYCGDGTECVAGNEVALGICADGSVWVTVAAFAPFPLGAILAVILALTT
jgi:hypothetical protein